MSRSPSKVECRRRNRRFTVAVPLKVAIGNREVVGYTRDLSNRGVYFYLSVTNAALIGVEIECVVELPPEITLSSCCRIRCRARIVRRERSSNLLSGIAAEILDYSILENAASSG
jgi:hypothetical protein